MWLLSQFTGYTLQMFAGNCRDSAGGFCNICRENHVIYVYRFFLQFLQSCKYCRVSLQILQKTPCRVPAIPCKHLQCSYLYIYILQKILLCVVDFKGQFQTILHVKSIQFFFIWKFNLSYSFLFHFLQELSNPLFFPHQCSVAIPKNWNVWLVIWHKNIDLLRSFLE